LSQPNRACQVSDGHRALAILPALARAGLVDAVVMALSKFSDHLISTAIWGIKSRKEPVTFHYKMRPPASFATFPTVMSCWRLFIQF